MKFEKDMPKGVHFRSSYFFFISDPRDLDLNIYQDVELTIGNLHNYEV